MDLANCISSHELASNRDKGKLVERQGRKAKGLRLRASYDRLVTGIRMYLFPHVMHLCPYVLDRPSL